MEPMLLQSAPVAGGTLLSAPEAGAPGLRRIESFASWNLDHIGQRFKSELKVSVKKFLRLQYTRWCEARA